MSIDSEEITNISITKYNPDDCHDLLYYLQNLGDDTKKRFAPHPFNHESLIGFYQPGNFNQGYIVRHANSQQIIAYAIIHFGYLDHDAPRLNGYGLNLNHFTDCVFAPSVADAWQGKGIGKQLFRYILADVKQRGFKRILLWGGVQADNTGAVNYYLKSGFTIMGQFYHHGLNLDMICQLDEL